MLGHIHEMNVVCDQVPNLHLAHPLTLGRGQFNETRTLILQKKVLGGEGGECVERVDEARKENEGFLHFLKNIGRLRTDPIR